MRPERGSSPHDGAAAMRRTRPGENHPAWTVEGVSLSVRIASWYIDKRVEPWRELPEMARSSLRSRWLNGVLSRVVSDPSPTTWVDNEPLFAPKVFAEDTINGRQTASSGSAASEMELPD